MRRLALLLAGAGLLLAGCGSRPEAVTTVTQVRTVRHVDPVPNVRVHAVQVTVLDGDTSTRVRGARVTVGKRSARSDRHGVARIPLRRRASLVTVAAKSGYDERAVRLSFRTRPKSTIRIYRRALQWGMYGADPSRTQAQPRLRVPTSLGFVEQDQRAHRACSIFPRAMPTKSQLRRPFRKARTIDPRPIPRELEEHAERAVELCPVLALKLARRA